MDKMLRDKKVILTLVTPVLVVFSLMIPIPLITTLVLSLCKWNMIGTVKFVGLSNFQYMFAIDDIFLQSVGNTIMYLVYSIVMQIPFAIFLAIFLTRGRRFEKLFSNILFMPVALSGTAVALMFYFIYHPTGIVNAALSAVGLEALARPWLADEGTAMLAVCVRVAWQFVGYHMVIYITGITGISEDLLEAAKIDGASIWQTSMRIILPLLKPVMLVSFILICTSSLKSFDSIFVMTKGGPMNATEVMASHMYNKSFLQLDYGYGSAIGAVLFLMCIGITLVLNYVFRDKDAQLATRAARVKKKGGTP